MMHVHRRAGIQSSLVQERPRGARGLLPLIAAALGVAKGVVGAVQANQTKKKNEGYIEQSYNSSSKRLKTRQQQIRQATGESLNARGLGGTTSAVRAAMAPRTIGQQTQFDDEGQFTDERTDLANERERALQENTDARTNAYLNSGFQIASAGLQGYEAKAGLQDSQIRQAMTPKPSMVGVDDPNNWEFGAIGHDPLDHPNSSWNRGTNVSGGETNANFRVG